MVAVCVGSGLAEVFEGHLAGIPWLVGAAFFVGVAYAGGIMAVRAKEREESLLYVPSVHEQVANLPTNEVLLRGSDRPQASQRELLRAANEVAAARSEELLRPAPSDESKPGDR